MILKLSVKQLVEFACRSGDLVGAGQAGPTAQQGIKAHQQLQSRRADTHSSEVALKAVLQVDDTEVRLGGRIDLLNDSVTPASLEEIKSTLVPPDKLSDSIVNLHWAQLKVYGYLYLLKQREKKTEVPDLIERACTDAGQSVALTLLWINLRDQSEIPETRVCQWQELEEFVLAALQTTVAWHARMETSRETMRDSATVMEFPFERFRAGQRDMAKAVYRGHRDKATLLCEAPTGIGKTISSLFPATKAMAEKHVRQVVYLTAKTSGRTVAQEAVFKMQNAGLAATSVIIQSKVTACHCSNGTCDRTAEGRCPLTIGFFDRLPAARERVYEAGLADAETIDRVATEFQVCPFELSLQMLPWVDYVFCDYNYVFDPLVRLTYFAEHEKHIGFLVDEAHNLSDRARMMYSAQLSQAQNLTVERDCKKQFPLLAKRASGLNRALTRWHASRAVVEEPDIDQSTVSDDANEWATTKKPDTVTRAVAKCLEEIEATVEFGLLPNSVTEWFKELFRYRVIEELFSESHRTLSRETDGFGKNRIELRLVCIDASDRLRTSFKQLHSASVFSATLRPQHFFMDSLGLPEESTAMTLQSPFNPEQMACLVCSYIDTRYHARQRSLEDLVALIHRVSSGKPGNYLVFFPSYAYMEQVSDLYRERYPDQYMLVQQRYSDTRARTEFLDEFDGSRRVLGFAIMGGIYGEGVDFPGEKLLGAIVIGTGLPPSDTEQKLISRGFADKGLDGFDYAYRYPGFTRVLQTAGRVIRSREDCGVVVLVDQRFAQPFYKALYPVHWNTQIFRDLGGVESRLDGFWSGLQMAEGKTLA